jgi:hypothetical protein
MNYLTDDEIGMLLNLVRDDARLLGFGTAYTDQNKKDWPRRLKKLLTIANKLGRERESRRFVADLVPPMGRNL